jgi:hypothetical protein
MKENSNVRHANTHTQVGTIIKILNQYIYYIIMFLKE